ncbi:hypothetical protein BDN72DRAFT_861316 [Pluteus cervinus]|uniref:Uncharacterized protein n=1 Tax=Pluteus cervinus TaxID=181527 RepID=A0ACD3AGG9_9AGAR|nr:hypothetical protein BDN72DRAFT_861316 [Pluteus cervinus]
MAVTEPEIQKRNACTQHFLCQDEAVAGLARNLLTQPTHVYMLDYPHSMGSIHRVPLFAFYHQLHLLPSTPTRYHGYVLIIAGTTNAGFCEWAFANLLNAIILEPSSGSKTTQLLVTAKGEPRGERLRPASCCNWSVRLLWSSHIHYAAIREDDGLPVKMHVALAIPPTDGYDIPKQVKKLMKDAKITPRSVCSCTSEFYQEMQRRRLPSAKGLGGMQAIQATFPENLPDKAIVEVGRSTVKRTQVF